MSIAVYPGSFDPITNGHIDVIRRGTKVFERLIVAVADNPAKQSLFTKDERTEMIRDVTKGFKTVEIDAFDGLVAAYVTRQQAAAISRCTRSIACFWTGR